MIKQARISSKLADIRYDKVENNQVPRIETIQQELSTPEVKERI